MLGSYFLYGDINDVFLPLDPEFDLEAVVYTITIYKYAKNNIYLVPPFHIQKHMQEAIERNLVFMRSLKAIFSNAISFKPSVFDALPKRIDDMCAKYVAYTTGNDSHRGMGRRGASGEGKHI